MNGANLRSAKDKENVMLLVGRIMVLLCGRKRLRLGIILLKSLIWTMGRFDITFITDVMVFNFTVTKGKCVRVNVTVDVRIAINILFGFNVCRRGCRVCPGIHRTEGGGD